VAVKAPPHPPRQDELDALIEEARRRARRRRLGYLALAAAAALVAGGAYLAIGGGGGGGVSGNPASSGPGAAATPGSSSSSEAAGYRCPTSIAALRKSRPGNGIPGCSFHFSATLPAGWHEDGARLTVFPPNLVVGGLASMVRYANFALATDPLWPPSMPPDGIAIGIDGGAPASRAELARAGTVALRPSDFRRVDAKPLARKSLYTGGRRFEALVRTGTSPPPSELLGEANAVLNSIETTQHLCPCGAR
jgi:hypothetical protein